MSDNPFPDTPQDILRNRVMQALMQMRLDVLGLEADCDSLRQRIEDFEDELQERWEQEDEAN